ncbi:MAG: hypothetical protein RLY58_1853 [Pseudomonadota bacterium]
MLHHSLWVNLSALMDDKWFGGSRPDYLQVSLSAIANTMASDLVDTFSTSRAGQAMQRGLTGFGEQIRGDGLDVSEFNRSGLNVGLLNERVNDGFNQKVETIFAGYDANDNEMRDIIMPNAFGEFTENIPNTTDDQRHVLIRSDGSGRIETEIAGGDVEVSDIPASPYEMTLTGSPSDGDIPPSVIPASRSKGSLNRRSDAVSEWFDASTPFSFSFVQTQATGNPWIDNTLLPVAQIGDLIGNVVSNTAKAAGNLATLGLNAPAGVFSAVSGDYDESQRQWDAILLSTPITTGFSGVGRYLRSARTINAASLRNMGVMGSQRGMIDFRLVDEARIGTNSAIRRPFGSGSANPAEINFTQPGVNTNVQQYVDDMANGRWDWQRSGPLRVMEVDGQLVSYDNRRLMASRIAGVKEVPIEVVNPLDIMPGSKKTWQKAFDIRRNMEINRVDGKPVPPTGLPSLPRINPPKSTP